MARKNATSLREQLRAAWLASGLTMADLVRRSGLRVDACSLSRKLSGAQSLRTEEAEALARALGVLVVAGEVRAS